MISENGNFPAKYQIESEIEERIPIKLVGKPLMVNIMELSHKDWQDYQQVKPSVKAE